MEIWLFVGSIKPCHAASPSLHCAVTAVILLSSIGTYLGGSAVRWCVARTEDCWQQLFSRWGWPASLARPEPDRPSRSGPQSTLTELIHSHCIVTDGHCIVTRHYSHYLGLTHLLAGAQHVFFFFFFKRFLTQVARWRRKRGVAGAAFQARCHRGAVKGHRCFPALFLTQGMQNTPCFLKYEPDKLGCNSYFLHFFMFLTSTGSCHGSYGQYFGLVQLQSV